MIPDFGTILAVAVIAAIIGGLFWYSRRTPAKQAEIRGEVAEVVAALKATADRAIDRLHDSTPATPAPAAQINAGAAIAAPVVQPYVAPASAPQTTIERAGALLAGDVPGGGGLPAGVRYATPADMAAGVPPTGGSVWPQTVILADGTRMLAKAPVSPLYRTSLMGTLMGKPIPGGGGHAADPANGDEATPPLPLRSPAGFPIRYSLAGGAVVGTPTILWGDHSFNSDAEVLDFIKRTLRTPDQEAAAAAAWAASQERLRERAAATPVGLSSNLPPYHPEHPNNLGKQPIYTGAPGTWGAAREGDAGSLGNVGGNAGYYDNVTGNPAWAHADNPPYRWDGARWVRP